MPLISNDLGGGGGGGGGQRCTCSWRHTMTCRRKGGRRFPYPKVETVNDDVVHVP